MYSFSIMGSKHHKPTNSTKKHKKRNKKQRTDNEKWKEFSKPEFAPVTFPNLKIEK